MTSILPDTGTTIVMSRVRNAYNLVGTPISLGSTLGPQISITPGTTISLSSSFGGRTAPGNYYA